MVRPNKRPSQRFQQHLSGSAKTLGNLLEAGNPLEPGSTWSNACSSCYKLRFDNTLSTRGLWPVIRFPCNKLPGSGYKQVFDTSKR